jgi:hypothetical protein
LMFRGGSRLRQERAFGGRLVGSRLVYDRVLAMLRGGGLGAYAANGFVPELVADFSTGRYWSSSSGTDFSTLFAASTGRSGVATYTDETGTIQTAASGVTRIGDHRWNGSAWVNEGALVETETRTTALTNREDLSNAAWSKLGITIGTPVSRKGVSLDELVTDAAATFRWVSQGTLTVEDGEIAVFSCFVEAGTSPETGIRIDDVGGTGTSNRVSLPITWTDGVPSFQSDASSGLTYLNSHIEDRADGLYRIQLVIQNNTGGSLDLHGVYYGRWDGPTVEETTYAGGFQFELASAKFPWASSYITPTETSRSGDTGGLAAAGSLLPWTAAGISIAIQGRVGYGDAGTFENIQFYDWRVNANNLLRLVGNTTTAFTGQVQAVQVESGTTDSAVADPELTPGPSVPYALAVAHGETSIQAAQNGAAGTVNSTPTALADVSEQTARFAREYMGTVRQIVVWGNVIGEAGLEEASRSPFA